MSKNMKKNKYIIIAIFSLLMFSSCQQYTPLPRAYFRIKLNEKQYTKSDTTKPYIFEYPSNIARIVTRNNNEWFDIVYPQYNARIYCSYTPIKNNFYEISEDSRTFVYKHSIKADAITEQAFENTNNDVYGILYEIRGNTASSVQFVLTDSTKNFLRGALYFNNIPNKDSLAPVINYIKDDVIRIMETTKWQ